MANFAKPVVRGSPRPATSRLDELYMEISLRGDLADKVLRHARRLGVRPIDLVADVIDRVFLEDLVDAVVDP